MDFGDDQPPNFYSKDILRKAKQDVVDSNLRIQGSDPVLSLIELKRGSEHNGNIHTISIDKIFVHYWSPMQCHIMYKVIRRQKWVTISVDATGSLILPYQRTSSKTSSGHIFLYQMVVTSYESQTISIAQQLSEKQDTLSIYYWMANWVSSGMKSPDECISDYSKALLGAITRAFCNKMSLQEYTEACFYCLVNNSTNVPASFIRINVAHLVHMICRWKCLQGRKPIKDFYVRAIGLLIQSEYFDIFDSILRSILIQALAETDSYNDNAKQETPSETVRIFLENVISGVKNMDIVGGEKYKGISNDSTFYFDSEQNENKSIDTSLLNTWLSSVERDSIQESVVKSCRLNAYYCPELKRPLLNILKEFALWSGVMV